MLKEELKKLTKDELITKCIQLEVSVEGYKENAESAYKQVNVMQQTLNEQTMQINKDINEIVDATNSFTRHITRITKNKKEW